MIALTKNCVYLKLPLCNHRSESLNGIQHLAEDATTNWDGYHFRMHTPTFQSFKHRTIIALEKKTKNLNENKPYMRLHIIELLHKCSSLQIIRPIELGDNLLVDTKLASQRRKHSQLVLGQTNSPVMTAMHFQKASSTNINQILIQKRSNTNFASSCTNNRSSLRSGASINIGLHFRQC